MTHATRADDDETNVVPTARTSPNLLQRRATFETITNVFAGAEQTLGTWRQSIRLDGEQSLVALFTSEKERDAPDSDGETTTSDEEAYRPTGPSPSHRGGLSYWAPALYQWLAPRVGTRERFFIAVMFSILDAVRNRLIETSGNEVNQLSIQFIGYLVSLFFGLSISVFMEGQWGASRIFSCAALWRWSVVGLFFALKSMLLCVAYESGLHKMITILIGFLYVVIAAVVSFFVFSRLYGKLEWLSLSMIILSAPAFYIMRERCNTNYCHFFDFESSDLSALGAFCAFAGVSLSAIASILAERLFKNFSKGINRRDRRDDFNHGKYYIHRVHLDFSAALFLSAVWLWQHFLVHDDSLSNTRVLFGRWSAKHYVLVCVHAAQAWWAGLVVMHFSTVTKSLIQTVMGLLGLCIIDPLYGIDQGHNFGIRAVPSLLIAFIVVMSAILFQTGRLNMTFLRERAGVSPEQEVGGFRSLKRYLYSILCESQENGTQAENGNQAIQRCNLLVYCLPVFYIISNALQTELTNTASANRFFVPQSLQVGIPLCGLSFAHVLTLQSYGLKGLAEAWNPRSIPKFLLLGLMQSVVSALAGMSMGLGMDSSLYAAMGKIYTPLSLVLGRWILKRRYLWIEWLSVMVLFVASVTLAFMDSSVAGNSSVRPSSAAAILCCAASASMACVYSVTMELALQKGNTPYVVNKIRLDFGAFLWSISFLPVMGYLGVKGHRPDLAYWYYRPSDYWTCIKLGSCDQESGLFVLHNSTDATALAKMGCYCDNGVFLGWGTWLPYAALASGVVYSWLTGKVIENFGTVMRSVLDGFPIVLLWFFISPMASRIPLAAFQAVYYKGPWPFINRAWGKDLMTIVNPLSAITYIEAAAQVRHVATLRHEAELEEANGYTNGSVEHQELSTESDDDESQTGSSWTPDEDECNC